MKRVRTAAFSILLGTTACAELPNPTEPIISEELAPSLAVQGEIERLPFWKRGPVCCIDDHVLIYFYVADPSAVPSDLNLLGFQFDPRALAAEFAVSGFNLRGDASDPLPRKTHLKGIAPVPFWFVPRGLFEQASSDGFLSVSELADEASLLRGYAEQFREELHPSPPANSVHLSMTARGTWRVVRCSQPA